MQHCINQSRNKLLTQSDQRLTTQKNSVPRRKTHSAVLIFVSLTLSQTPVYTANHEYGDSASRGVPV